MLTHLSIFQEHIDIKPSRIKAINGIIPDVGTSWGYPTGFDASSSSSVGTTAVLGVIFCVVLVIGTALVLMWKGKKSDDRSWSLPMTSGGYTKYD